MSVHRLLAGVVACAALFVAAGNARGEVVFNDTTPIEGDFPNHCTGEFVHVIGELHRVVSIVVHTDGSFQVHNNVTAHGWGIGLDSGAEYQWNESILDTQDNPPGVALSETVNQKVRFIGLGDTPNQRVVFSLQVTIDEFGVLTSVVVTDIFCQGE